MSWRWVWVRAQVPAWLVAACVAAVLLGVAPLALPAVAAIVVAVLSWWHSAALMWLRYGAKRADAGVAARFLMLLVPIQSMRGRGQPRLWVAERMSGADCVMSGDHDLVVSLRLLRWAMAGEVSQERVCAVVAHAKGLRAVWGSPLAAVSWLLGAPWRAVVAARDALRSRKALAAVAALAWRMRWPVGVVAVVQQVWAGRWPAAVSVAVLLTLTWVVPRWEAALSQRLARIGDRQAVAEGFGAELAEALRAHRGSVADLARVAELDRLLGRSTGHQ